MAAIDVITGHYNESRRQWLDVPEWQVEGKPLRIFWQLLTIDKRKAMFTLPERTDADTFIAMAQDEAGAPLFDKADRPKLMLSADAAIITRIVFKMLGANRVTEASVEDALKN